jgi:hypothetical protein
MGHDHIRSVALFLIVLVLTIPLHTSLVLASISSVSAHGAAGVEGYVTSADDAVTYTVVLTEPVTSDRLKTTYPSDEFFTSCNATRCAYQSDMQDFPSGIHAYQIVMFDDTGIPVDSKDRTLIADGSAPLISSFSVDGTTYSYTVTDGACSGCPGCIGLSKLAIREGQTIVATQNLSGCSASGSGTLGALNADEGDVTFCLTVTDRGGLVSDERCTSTSVDTKTPVIGTVRLIDESGNDLRYVSALPVDARAEVNITETNAVSVIGNFSALNIASPELYAALEATCVKEGSVNVCSWSGISVDGAEGMVAVVINATDDSGNSATASKTFTLIRDTTPPSINRIYVNPDIDYDKLVLKSGENVITAELAAGGAPYTARKVTLDLSAFGSGPVQTEGCVPSGTVYRCTFRATISGSDGLTGSVGLSATDDAGNSMATPFTTHAVVDAKAPMIRSVTPSSPCATGGKEFTLDVVVEDTTPISVTLNISRISTDDSVAAVCGEKVAGAYTCTASVTGIVTTYLKDTVDITVRDAADNTVTKHETVEVCEEEGSEIPNFFRVSASAASTVDRRVLSFMAVPAYVSLSLQGIGGASVVDKSVSCSGTESAYLLDKTSTNPTLVVKLAQQSLSQNATGPEIIVDCDLDMIVKKGHKLYASPEHEDLTITIPLQNNPLGDIGTSMQAKIQGADDDIKDLEKEIKSWEKYNKMLAMLCTTAELMGTINSIMQAIKSVYWAVTCTTWTTCTAMEATVVGSAPGEACAESSSSSWVFGCMGLGYFNYFVEAFIWPTGIIGPSPIGAVVKYGCMLYTCRLCDWSTAIRVGIYFGGKALNDLNVDYRSKQLTDTAGLNYRYYPGTAYGYKSPATAKVAGSSGSSSASGSVYSSDWNSQASKTGIATNILSDNWIFDPYKSIHYATACLCMPGMIYNLKKDRQIKCIYKSCLQQNARMGLPTSTCDEAYREQECLYVDSAQYKLHGYMGGFLESLVDALVSSLPGIVLGITYSAACPAYKFDPTQSGCSKALAVGPCGTYERVICGLSSAAVAGAEIYDMVSGGIDFKKYDASLEGTDFCSGGAEAAK